MSGVHHHLNVVIWSFSSLLEKNPITLMKLKYLYTLNNGIQNITCTCPMHKNMCIKEVCQLVST